MYVYDIEEEDRLSDDWAISSEVIYTTNYIYCPIDPTNGEGEINTISVTLPTGMII